ncbi:MAG TPA: DUF6531 domain-containing protein, partial [Arenimonas sp.]
MYRCADGDWKFPSGFPGDVERCWTEDNQAEDTKNQGQPECKEACAGSGINAATGNKYETDSGYAGEGPWPLEFNWTYNSQSVTSAADTSQVGAKRATTFSRKLSWFAQDDLESVYIDRPDGGVLRFDRSGSAWVNSGTGGETLTGNPQTHWVLEDEAGRRDHYDAAGRLLYLDDPNGRRITLEYDGNGRVVAAVDPQGRSLVLQYNVDGNLERLSLPDGGFVDFSYSIEGQLTEVTYPDGKSIQYLYDEAAHNSSNETDLLTGILDETGARKLTVTYDAYGKAIASLTGGLVSRSNSYIDSGKRYHSSAQVNLPGGATRDVTFGIERGHALVRSATTSCTDCTPVTTTYEYDGLGRVASKGENGIYTTYEHNARGLEINRREGMSPDQPPSCPAGSTYYSDSYGTRCGGGSCWASSPFPGSQSGEPFGYPTEQYSCLLPATYVGIAGASREIQTDWHADFRVPVARRVLDHAGTLVAHTQWTHNARGQVLTETQLDPASSATRSTQYTYCEATGVSTGTCPMVGLLTAIDGPRSDVSDVTLLTYYPADAAGCASGPAGCTYRRGDLWKLTNAAGHVHEVLAYDGAGRVKQSRDPLGVVTDFEYSPRGWLLASKRRGPLGGSETDDQVTAFTHDDTGRIVSVSTPGGSTLSLSYDAAGRLVGLQDALGNRVDYVLDAAGNRVQEDYKDSSQTLRRTLSRLYNGLSQLTVLADAQATPTDFAYDSQGHLASVTDPLGRQSTQTHDALGRLRQAIANVGGAANESASTQFEYDALDRLTAVIDPKGLTTQYSYNGFGDLVDLVSPDTGTTSYTHDAAGQQTGRLDARGILTQYSYDALGRLLALDVPTTGEDTSFSYDTAPTACQSGETFALGRLSTISNYAGSTNYCYDRFGQVARKAQQVTGGPSAVVAYGHDTGGRLSSLTYPSGAVVTYQRDAAGRISQVRVKRTPTTATETVVSQVGYLPFGPVTSLTFGNGRVLSKAYDLNYGIDSIQDNAASGLSIDFALDNVGNVVGLDERQVSGATAARTVDYDGMDRLLALNNGAS